MLQLVCSFDHYVMLIQLVPIITIWYEVTTLYKFICCHALLDACSFQEMVKHTAESHPDRNQLESALEEMNVGCI